MAFPWDFSKWKQLNISSKTLLHVQYRKLSWKMFIYNKAKVSWEKIQKVNLKKKKLSHETPFLWKECCPFPQKLRWENWERWCMLSSQKLPCIGIVHTLLCWVLSVLSNSRGTAVMLNQAIFTYWCLFICLRRYCRNAYHKRIWLNTKYRSRNNVIVMCYSLYFPLLQSFF